MQNLWSRVDGIVRPAGHVFFGWYIVGAAGGLQLLAGFLWMHSYGAYVVLLQEEFGWSKTLIAAAFALTRIESGILGPLQGWLTDRYGPRLILGIGILIFGFGFMLFSQIQTLLGFYLTFALIAVGSSLGGFATVMVSLVNWFSRHRAKAVAMSQMGYAIGGLAVPLIILCLEAFGWRTTAMYSGVLVIVTGLPLVLLVRHRPQDYGEVADGYDAVDADGKKIVFDASRDFTARQAMRTSSFWLISAGHACALLTVSSLMVHLVSHLKDGLGYTLAQAGLVIAMVTGFQMVGQIVGGFLGDRFNKQVICVLCMIAHTSALLLLSFTEELSMIILFAALHGMAWGIRGPLMVALRADYFGPSSFGTIMGFSSLVVMLGMSIGPVYAGYMADLHGDYVIAFSTLGLGALVGSLCFAFAGPPSHPDSVKLSVTSH
ncbi:MAG: sugar phosphate permease [Candidatus Azotimanducaceae bacterium]|jgi:sugar phosphate permease